MGLFKKSLPGILKGFHKTVKALDALDEQHGAEIEYNRMMANHFKSEADNHDKAADALVGARREAMAIRDKIAGLVSGA